MSDPPDDCDALAGRLAVHLGHASAPQFIGQGSNNKVYRLDETTALKLAKPDRAAVAAVEHAKERWCASAARALGIATPAVLSAAEFEGRPYCLQTFTEGKTPGDRTRAWHAMGGMARTFHGVPVAGWGPVYAHDNIFADDWQKQLAYNIASLSNEDALLALGAIDRQRSDDLRRRFERLVTTPFTMGLCHGDLGVHNLIEDEHGRFALIDWGCAAAAPVPHYDLNEAIRTGRATRKELDMFREAYGATAAEWTAIERDLPDLLALREIDTLRWAIDRMPDRIEDQKQRVLWAMSHLI